MQAPELLVTRDQVNQLFPSQEPIRPEAIHGRPFMANGVEIRFSTTTLGLEACVPSAERPDAEFKVVGNTVPRICSASECSVSVCGLGREVMSNAERRNRDCASATTLLATPDRPGYVMTPISSSVVFLNDPESRKAVTALDEGGNEQVMFDKLSDGCTVIVAEQDIPNGAEGITVIANAADSAVGVATTEVDGVRYAIPFHSYQPHLGDRGPDNRILVKAINAIADKHELQGEARQQAIRDLAIRIDIGFAASLENFGHQVRIPKLSLPAELSGIAPTDLTKDQLRQLDGASKLAIRLMISKGYGDHSQIRPKDVMDDLYPGALENGEIYPEYEARNGIPAPYTEGGCPGDGQLCHIDYPGITRRTLVGQLEALGVRAEGIRYDQGRAIDTASADNYLASNRLAQLAGVPRQQTLRSANSVGIAFPAR